VRVSKQEQRRSGLILSVLRLGVAGQWAVAESDDDISVIRNVCRLDGWYSQKRTSVTGEGHGGSCGLHSYRAGSDKRLDRGLGVVVPTRDEHDLGMTLQHGQEREGGCVVVVG